MFCFVFNLAEEGMGKQKQKQKAGVRRSSGCLSVSVVGLVLRVT